MKLWPDSLFGRLIAALGAVIVSIAAIIALLIVREHRELELRGSGVDAVAEDILGHVRALEQLHGPQRSAGLAERVVGPLLPPVAARGSDERRDAVHAERVRRLPRRALENRLADRLRKALGGDYRIEVRRARRPNGPFIPVGVLGDVLAGDFAGVAERRAQRADGAGAALERPPRMRLLRIDVRLPDGTPLAFRSVEPELGPELPQRIFRDLLLLFLLVAAVLYFTTRSITRPLRELEAAADALGRGQRKIVLRESGARELRNATRAFNAMQERLNRYLDGRTRVLAAMSHDLRTPLTRLRLRAEKLTDATQREQVIADLDEMATMVNQALQLFRGQDAEEATETVNVRALLDEFSADAAAAGNVIDVNGADVAAVHVQPQALRRCLANLLDNAVRYGHAAHVDISATRDAVLVRILDDGPGMGQADLAQAFEPFYRGEASRNADTGGTGLGLGIARDLAQAQGGTLTLRNADEGGLVAELTLPREWR